MPHGPNLVFTHVPAWNSFERLEGKVFNLDPATHCVAVCIELHGTWWTKPLWATPCVAIRADGTWDCTITTGGSDEKATTIAAFVLESTCSPPLLGGQPELPRELLDCAVVSRRVSRSSPRIRFSGYEWMVKSGRWGPDNNDFSHGPRNVWVDAEDRLHLRITHTQGLWKCAEVVLTESLGFGTYRFYLDSPVGDPPDNVVVGLFS